ncbi:MAG: hypothetical protein ABIK89_16390, partial [Planctomycetota bacterium]
MNFRTVFSTIRRWRLVIAVLALAVASVSASHAQLQGGSVCPINGTQNPPVSFSNITNAVAYLGANGVTGTGQVVLELQTGYAGTEPVRVTIPPITGTSGTLGITFRPGLGYSAQTVVAGTTLTNSFAVAITGSYITLDGQAGGCSGGRDWTIRCTGSGTGGYGRTAVRFGSTPATGSQTDVTVKYCILEAEAANSYSAIVAVEGSNTYTSKKITIANNLIRSTGVSAANCRGVGITLGYATNAGNTGWVVRDNVIDRFNATGINLNGGSPGILIYNNDIAHTAAVAPPSPPAAFYGIRFFTSASAGAQVYKNFIHDIQIANSSSAVIGIEASNLSTTGEPVRFYNNRVAIGPGVPTACFVSGIRESSSSGGLIDYDYNSVYIGGALTEGDGFSTAFGKAYGTLMNIRNNAFYNARSNSGTASGTNYAIALGDTNLGSINNNDYFVSGTGGVLGTTDYQTTGNQTTLEAWKAAVPMDTESISQDPNYVDPLATPPDLTINTALPTQLESGGQVVAEIDDDFQGDIRFGSPGYAGPGTAPDIGADEFGDEDLAPPTITYALLLNAPSTTTRSLGNVTMTDWSGVDGNVGTRPRVYYKTSSHANALNDNSSATDGWKYAEANGSSSPFDFTIDYSRVYGGGVVEGDVVQYFVVAQDLAPVPNVGINAGSFATAPASVALESGAFPIDGTINSYAVLGAVAAISDV